MALAPPRPPRVYQCPKQHSCRELCQGSPVLPGFFCAIASCLALVPAAKARMRWSVESRNTKPTGSWRTPLKQQGTYVGCDQDEVLKIREA